MLKAVVINVLLIFALLTMPTFISPTSVSSNGWGGATPPFIVEGIVRYADKQPGYVGSRYDVESKEWGMTFQVSVMPGHGQIDDRINVGDSVQVCGERGKGIEQTSVKLNKGNHYIQRTGLATSPFAKQSNTPVIPNDPDAMIVQPELGKDTRDFCDVWNGYFRSALGPCCFCQGLAMTKPEDAAKLDTLRAFRDKVLRQSDAGKAFIFFYYWIFSPVAIAVLSGNEPAIYLIRSVVVEPMVWAVSGSVSF